MQNGKNYNNGLEEIIRDSGRISRKLGELPGSFAETLTILMKEKKMSRGRLSIESNVSETTLTRMRSSDDNSFSKQAIIAVCIGMRLTPAEAFSLLDKSCCKLMMTSEQDIAYYHILSSCGSYRIDEVNEILRAKGYDELGGK